VQRIGLDPPGGGLALAGRAAPLRRLALIVGPGERPCAVLAGRRLVVALGHGGRLAERDDRAAVAVLAPVVDRPTSQPLSIEHVKALRVLRLSSFCASVASRPSWGGSERRAAMTSQASAVAWERLLSDLLSRSARGRWRAHSSAAPSTTAIRRAMPSARRCTRPPERGHHRRRRKRSNRQSQVACCGVAQDRRRGGQLPVLREVEDEVVGTHDGRVGVEGPFRPDRPVQAAEGVRVL
jgi:hypothetical protein